MNKTYISSLLVVFMAGAQTIRAQGSLDDIFSQLDAAEGSGAVAPATVEAAGPAAISSGDAETAPASKEAKAGKKQGDLLSTGIDLYEAGRFDEAQATFEAVLAEDQYNRLAMSYLQKTADHISANEKRKLEATRKVAMAKIDATWNPDFESSVAVAATSAEPVETEENIAIRKMTAHLKSIVIPTLDFRDANIKDVVLFLTETCRRMDASVNIILLGLGSSDSVGSVQGNNITISIRDMNLYDALQYIVEMASLKFEVQASVVTISPVNYVRDVDVKLESFKVIPEVGEELASMAGGEDTGGGMDDLFGGSSASSSTATGPVDVSAFFSIVSWPEGASAIYYPSFKKLVVKNTPLNIKAVKEILDDLEDEAIKKRSQQVEIEAKFVEFNEGAFEELGFNWNIYGSGTIGDMGLVNGSTYTPVEGYTAGSRTAVANNTTTSTSTGNQIYVSPVSGYAVVSPNPPAGTVGKKPGESLFGGGARSNTKAFETVTTGVLASMGGQVPSMLFSNGDIDLKISAMEQEGTADVLSSPKVTTQSGYEAVIRVVEIHRYPQDYDVETGQRTAPVVKPQDWEDFDLGVVLRVTPEVDPESNTIKLELNPEIKKFKGFEDYAVAVNAYISDDLGGTTKYGDGNQLFARMPYFETRSVQTRVTVADGSTVMMGGLVDERTETFRDQVPILGDIPYIGRLFRTEGSRSSKKNLVIYVKATQVDERGMTRKDRELARAAIVAAE